MRSPAPLAHAGHGREYKEINVCGRSTHREEGVGWGEVAEYLFQLSSRADYTIAARVLFLFSQGAFLARAELITPRMLNLENTYWCHSD